MGELFKMSFDVTGIDQLNRNLTKASEEVKKKAVEGMWEFAVMVWMRSQELVPVRTGILRATSPPPEKPEWINNALDTVIRYTRRYAIYQHEKPYKHVQGQWKYLQTAIEEKARLMVGIVAAHMRG